MKILIANDDGIFAPGIKALALAMQELGEVVVSAPAQHMSGMGSAITCTGSIKVEKIEFAPGIQGYKVFGTPRDCVDLALNTYAKDADLVVTGINEGPNLSTDVVCSGTCGSAIAALVYHIPTIATSLCYGDSYDYESVAKIIVKVAKWFYQKEYKKDFMLSVNVPNIPVEDIKGYVVTRFGGNRVYHVDYNTQFDGMYYYYNTHVNNIEIEDKLETLEGDHYALEQGYVSLTPIDADLVYSPALSLLNKDLGNL